MTHALRPALLLPLVLCSTLLAQRVAEVEPNDTAAQAQPVAFGVHVDANLGAADQDWYSFTLTSAAEVQITTCGNFAVNSAVDTAVLIYDAAGTTRLAWNDNQRGNHSDCGVNLAAGSYLCLVVGKGTAPTGDYGLDLIAYAPDVPTAFEGPEPNGDPQLGETPTPLAPGATITGTLSSPTDEDWYSFTLVNPSVVQAIVYDDGGVPQLDNANLSLRQEAGVGIWVAIGTASTSTSSHRCLTLNHAAALAPGNYALRIAAGSAATGTPPLDYAKAGVYGIRTRVIDLASGTAVVEAPEPNNTPATAGFMVLGDQATGFISGGNEGDWYGIPIPGGTTIVAMSEGGTPSPITDTTIRLWDTTGTTTLATATGGGTNSHGRLIFTVNQAGVYYLEVAGGLVASTGDYVLRSGSAPAMFTSATFNQQPPSTNACPGSNGLRPALNRANGEVPQIGSWYVMRVNNALPNAILFTALGFSNTSAFGGALPLPFEFPGATGCSLRVDPLILGVAIADAGGIAFWDFAIPNFAFYAGATCYAQCVLADPALNAAQLSVTNDVRFVLGDRGY